jgi:hypothetical protein
MAINYTYSKNKDVHTILNSNLFTIEYTINKISDDSSKLITRGNILLEQSFILPFIMDGNYEIILKTITGTIEEVKLPVIHYYNNLLKSFISLAESVLCGCSACKDCKDCNNCEDYLNSYVKAFAFSSLNQSLYKLYTDVIVTDLADSFNDAILSAMMKEKVYGNADYKEVILRIISYYYYAFYFKDKFVATTLSEKEYVATKYKFDTISKCIRKLGIDPSDAVTTFESLSRVYYWQLNSLTDTITQVLPTISPEFLETKLNTAYSIFEAGKIVPYSFTGRIVFVISNTGVTNFEITDSANNDITDEFNVQYNSTYSHILLVSKNVYGVMNVYFKFKKLI